MNKSELIKALSDETNISFDDATLVVNIFIDSMKKSLLDGDRIEIRGFGSFKIKNYGAYHGRNPKPEKAFPLFPSVCRFSELARS